MQAGHCARQVNDHNMKKFQFSFSESSKEHLPQQMQDLITAAENIAQKAYAPYSRFKVGAAILMADGRIITGNNHENASYPVGICAERAALSALDMSDKSQIAKAIAVTYKANEHTHNRPVAPCGMCRQAILELQQWQASPLAVYMHSPNGEVICVENAEHLLPFSFGSGDLHTTQV